ncbi:hypothetical protein A3SI_09647 [Nitritalea halalkaliphila LW7]|uniref:DUF4230 domain-containing protein n=1 Tax=Nitritalea halalkaliphila LW7 TaxID=1189621 RepID=I5C3Q3_9BACT|nr:DUF4230 domain-containing protein [Nitritalea halalkaliphila]EIM76455.1 hypothetical protein A3SI_09647 [Nitritalea halalkaliphila LW7]
MTRFLLGIITTLIIGLAAYMAFFKSAGVQEQIEIRHGDVIKEQVEQVGKLVVTEGNFSLVTSYENSKRLYFDLIKSNKKALVVVHAKVTVAYDLSQMRYEIDEENRILRILYIPDEELNIYPDIEYYDISQDYFNRFEAKDYNKVRAQATFRIKQQVLSSGIQQDGKKRLVEELGKLFFLTNMYGWELQYKETAVEDEAALKRLLR